MFAHFLQIAAKHLQHIHRVFKVLLVHVRLVVFNIRLDILDKTFREFCEVINVVQRVQDTVNKSLSKLTHCSHLLEFHHLISTLLNKLLQSDLIILEFTKS